MTENVWTYYSTVATIIPILILGISIQSLSVNKFLEKNEPVNKGLLLVTVIPVILVSIFSEVIALASLYSGTEILNNSAWVVAIGMIVPMLVIFFEYIFSMIGKEKDLGVFLSLILTGLAVLTNIALII